jgi:DNA-binding beta-propeller fold protein YncE
MTNGQASTNQETSEPQQIPTGKVITPMAAKGAIFQDLDPKFPGAPDKRASQAAAVAVSPDGRLLAILTSGFEAYMGPNGKPIPEFSTEYVFLYDVTGPQPKQLQALPIAHTFQGLAWAPSSNALYASGGKDDVVVEFVRDGSTLSAGRKLSLNHKGCAGFNPQADPKVFLATLGVCGPEAAGLSVSPDGSRLLVANIQNDSVSLVDVPSGQVVAEQDLRPGVIDPRLHGEPGGTYPRAVAWTAADHAYVASERDREVISLSISRDKIHVVRRMKVPGQPIALLANRNGSCLYVALDTTDQVAVFDTANDGAIETFDVTAPKTVYANTKMLGGANTNALALTPDEGTLLVSNGGENAIAVVRLSEKSRGALGGPEKSKDGDKDGDGDQESKASHSAVVGLVPTGWYPDGVATSKDGATWYVINDRHPLGPGFRRCEQSGQTNCLPADWDARKLEANHYVDQIRPLSLSQNKFIMALEKAGFLTLPAPAPLELARLTKQVARNNRFDQPDKTAADEHLFAFLRQHIKHVIYVVRENKTYDIVLGDFEKGNGDPTLALFPERTTPNAHSLVRNFVNLDNFYDSGESSWTGWDWSAAAQTNDLEQRAEPVAIANFYKNEPSGLQAGTTRNINTGYATSRQRHAIDPSAPSNPDIVAGAYSVYDVDGPGGAQGKGYIWDVALQGDKTVRNWGFFGTDRQKGSPLIHDPYSEKQQVFWARIPALMPCSDPYYRSFNLAVPDYWKFKEWKREFDQFSASQSAPNLMLVQLGNDHMGDYDRAIDGVNTPETQVADNDYAFGLMVETVANSPFAKDTLIIALEDDPGLGLDHVDGQRSFLLVAGPYVRQHQLVSTWYTTVSVIKTIEEILGVGPIGLNDAVAAPMSDLFDPSVTTWSYQAIVPDVLRSTQLPLPPSSRASIAYPTHSAAYWTKAMAHQDFSGPDRIEPISFNRELWRGLKGNAPYPLSQTGVDASRDHLNQTSRAQASESKPLR